MPRIDQDSVLVNNMYQGPGPWVVTHGYGFWYVIHKDTHRAKCIGRIGGPRGNGRGTNYCDRAKERCAQLNAKEAAKAALPA